MSDTIKSIYESFNNRLKNPFIGALFFTCLIFHWEQIIILFSSHLNGEEKIVCIKEINNLTNDSKYWYILEIALLYMFLPKLIMLLVEFFGTNRIEKMRYDLAYKKTLARNKLQNLDAIIEQKKKFEELNKTQGDQLFKLKEENTELKESNKILGQQKIDLSLLNNNLKKNAFYLSAIKKDIKTNKYVTQKDKELLMFIKNSKIHTFLESADSDLKTDTHDRLIGIRNKGLINIVSSDTANNYANYSLTSLGHVVLDDKLGPEEYLSN